MFDQDSIKKAISDSLSTDINIPSGHRGALVSIVTNNGATLAVATKINDKWRVELFGEHDWSGDNKIGVINKVTW